MTTIALPMFVMIAAIILLIVIGLILWHKKAASQEHSLQNIEERLDRIERDLKDYADKVQKQDQLVVPIKEEHPISQESELNLQDPQEAAISIEKPEDDGASAADAPEEASSEESLIQEQDVNTDRGGEAPTSIYNIGKSGKIYTEEELDLLIKE